MKRLMVIFAVIWTVMAGAPSYAGEAQKVLIVLTSHDELGESGLATGFWLPELTHPYYELIDAGYGVDVASIQGGMAPLDAKSYDESDPYNNRFLADADLMRRVIRTEPLSAYEAADYAAVIYSGGSGPMWDFPNNPDVHRITRNMYEQGGVVAAVCHGPAALVNITLSNGEYLIAGKDVTGFSNLEEVDLQQTEYLPFLLEDRLAERGGRYLAASPWEKNVIVDGRLVTGQNPASAGGVAHAVMEILEGGVQSID